MHGGADPSRWNPPLESPKLEFVDRMRGAAILLVIAVHFTQVFSDPLVRAAGSVGQVGVQMFFVASAFTLCRSADLRGAAGRAAEAHPLRNFYIRRLLRIAPLYWLALAIYILRGAARGETLFFTPLNIGANALFVHGLIPSANNTIVPGGWSIGAEMLFYLVFPFIFAALAQGWQRRGARAVVLGLALAVLAAAAWHFGYRIVMGRWIHNNFFAYCVIAAQLPVFMIGIAWYFAVLRAGAFAPRPARDAAGAALFLGGCAAIILTDSSPLFGLMPIVAGIGSVFAGQLLRLARRGTSWLAGIGKVSYSIYVLHFLVTWELIPRLLARLGGNLRYEALAIAPLYTASVLLLLAVGRITARVIEEPAAILARRIIQASEKRAETRAFVSA